MKKSQFLTNVSLYLRNDLRYGHRYYGMPMETVLNSNGTIFNGSE